MTFRLFRQPFYVFYVYLFIWLHWILAVAFRVFDL